MTDIKVCKFGGTSMANGMTVERVKKIAKSDPARRFFVVSAPGKRFGGEKKVTDLLYAAHDCLLLGGTLGEAFEKVKERFRLMTGELSLSFDIESLLSQTEEEILRRKSRPFTASRGEFLVAKIAASYLEVPFVDASELFCFKGDFLSEQETEKKMRERLLPLKGAVIPGFYGADGEGNIHTLPRGGGDISGAIVARALDAEIYENWTDVSGFLVCDPRIVENPQKIDCLSYAELKELSRLGANVLHHEAVAPVLEADIPVCIRNTFRPSDGGTTILSAKKNRPLSPVTGIAGGKNYVLCKFSSIPKIIFPYELLLSEEGNTLILAEGKNFENLPENGEWVAAVAVVGQNLNSSADALARIFKAIFQAGIKVLFAGFSSGIKLMIGVGKEDFERTVRAIYEEFYRI